MPAVSVCLPVYNGEAFLAGAIESVLSQSFEDFELLIANDCSKDASASIMSDYARKDKRVVAWTNQSNLGHYPNYNACIDRATGKYIKLFAQDDLLCPKFLERFVAVFEHNPKVSLINCARRWIDARGNEIKAESEIDLKLTKPFEQDTLISGSEAIGSTLKEAINWLGEPSSQMFRSAFIDGGFDISFNQIGDLEYNYRQLQNGDFQYIAEELCHFRRHADSWTIANASELSTYLDWLLLASKYRKYLALAGITPEEYCLNYIKTWTRNLECSLNELQRFDKEGREDALRELSNCTDPLSLFDCTKNSKRDLLSEFRALGATALLQSCILENELRQVHDAVAKPYSLPLESSKISAIRPALVAALEGLRQTLNARDKEIIELRQVLTAMGNSTSWKITAPLRKLTGGGN
jgi:glycosyltransferase involved in cell wall biosynthesis